MLTISIFLIEFLKIKVFKGIKKTFFIILNYISKYDFEEFGGFFGWILN